MLSALSEDSPPRIYIVLPAFNEAARLGRLIERIGAAMSSADFQIVIVDDGSRDATAQIANDLKKRWPIELRQHPINQGLGPTIRDGLQLAAQLANPRDVIVTLDADDTHPPEIIPAMVARLQKGRDVVIASRYRPQSKIHGVSPLRQAMSLGASWIFRLLFPISGVRDYTCGFRAYRAAVLQRAFHRYGQNFVDQQGFQCMVDILLKLRPLKLRFAEVPFVLSYDLKEGESKMRIGKTVMATLVLLLKRRFGSL